MTVIDGVEPVLIVVWLALAAIVIAAGAFDLWRYRIPNLLPLAVVALFVVVLLIRPMPDWYWHLLTAAGVFAGLFILFALGRLGGGDLKLISALALWSGPQLIVAQLLTMALAGGLFALLLLVGRWLLRKASASGGGAPGAVAERAPRLLQSGAPVPYGVAIALGWLLTTWHFAADHQPLHPGYFAAVV